MFINFSNHPSSKWDVKQKNEALKYGDIVDIPFPQVAPFGDETYISNLADEAVNSIEGLVEPQSAVMVQGEYNLTYEVVARLLSKGIRVVSACTDRDTVGEVDSFGNTVKQSRFTFTRFREYRNN